MPDIINHAPAGSSIKNVIHYGQLVNSAEFSMYDFGSEDNMQIYGQPEPPSWEVEKVTAPVATYFGANDWLNAEEVSLC